MMSLVSKSLWMKGVDVQRAQKHFLLGPRLLSLATLVFNRPAGALLQNFFYSTYILVNDDIHYTVLIKRQPSAEVDKYAEIFSFCIQDPLQQCGAKI